MRVMAFNGSPRKKMWNTVALLRHVLKGAASVGAKTELLHLYDLFRLYKLLFMQDCKRVFELGVRLANGQRP